MQTLLEKLEYSFFIESATIEKATFPYKTALSEANAKTNRMGSTRNGVLPVNNLFFRKFCFGLRSSYKELI